MASTPIGEFNLDRKIWSHFSETFGISVDQLVECCAIAFTAHDKTSLVVQEQITELRTIPFSELLNRLFALCIIAAKLAEQGLLSKQDSVQAFANADLDDAIDAIDLADCFDTPFCKTSFKPPPM